MTSVCARSDNNDRAECPPVLKLRVLNVDTRKRHTVQLPQRNVTVQDLRDALFEQHRCDGLRLFADAYPLHDPEESLVKVLLARTEPTVWATAEATYPLLVKMRFDDKAFDTRRDAFTLEACAALPLSGLKKMIEERTGRPSDEQHLIIAGDELNQEHGRTLGDCGNPRVVTVGTRPQFKLFVRNLKATVITVPAYDALSVEGLQERIASRTGIPLDRQRLIHGGRQLDAGRTLADYHILPETTLHLVLPMRGGMHVVSSGRVGFGVAVPPSAPKAPEVEDADLGWAPACASEHEWALWRTAAAATPAEADAHAASSCEDDQAWPAACEDEGEWDAWRAAATALDDESGRR